MTGDLALSDDGTSFVYISGAEQVVQDIKIRAQIFKGSWRYDLNEGVPYFQEILAFGATLGLVRKRFYDLVASTPGVQSVQSIRVFFQRPEIFVEFTCSVDGRAVTGVLDFRTVS